MGLATGNSLFPFLANLFMSKFEIEITELFYSCILRPDDYLVCSFRFNLIIKLSLVLQLKGKYPASLKFTDNIICYDRLVCLVVSMSDYLS